VIKEEFDKFLQANFPWDGILSCHPAIQDIIDKYESFDEFREMSDANDEDKINFMEFMSLSNIQDYSIEAAQKFLCIEALFFYPELFCHLGKVDDIAKAINDNKPLDGNKSIFTDVLNILGDKFLKDRSKDLTSV